ncbi:hypothetical protein J6590_086905 [Homalodisca vitripennis]|nr:hypothetical protein J6590_086905 [Homalodisca vitripennis]
MYKSVLRKKGSAWISLAGKTKRRLDCSSAGRLSYLRVAKRGRSRRASCDGLPGLLSRCTWSGVSGTNESCAGDRLPYITARLAHAQNP